MAALRKLRLGCALLCLAVTGCSNQDVLATNGLANSDEGASALALTAAETAARRVLLKESDEKKSAAEMEKVANTLLADVLYDPSSAQFRALGHGKGDAICGKVNAKNRYGAYVGFKDFVVPAGRKSVYVSENNDRLESSSTNLFALMFVEACGTKEERANYDREIASRYSTPTMDTDNLVVDDVKEAPDPFAD